MKKAQILSAIALAFALGVVAPVAATYAEDGIMPLAYDDEETAKTTANVAEVNAAISNIENATEYKAYSALAEAKTAATPAPTKPVDAADALKKRKKLYIHRPLCRWNIVPPGGNFSPIIKYSKC